MLNAFIFFSKYTECVESNNQSICHECVVCASTNDNPCMAINGSVQFNGGFLPDIKLLTLCYCHRGMRSNIMKRLWLGSLCSDLNVLIFPPCLGGAQKL